MTASDKFNNLLAIDSSGSTLRVGVSCGDVVTEQTSTDRFRHAEFIFNLIEKALRESGSRQGDLDGLAVSVGPGSFTGLRVGLAAAKGLALALSLPLIGISTFEAIAGKLYEKCGRVLILIPSRRGEYYVYESSDGPVDIGNITVKKSTEIVSIPGLPPVFMTDPNINDVQLKNIGRVDAADFEVSINHYIAAARNRLVDSGGDDIDRLVPLYIQTFPVKPGK
jgi:tRNA threonylcarbamoyl adenosine modification protein YeaZ